MTLDTQKPSGSEHMVSSLDDYIREGRVDINALWAAVAALGWTPGMVVATIMDLSMSAAQTELVTGTDVSDIPLETVNLTGDSGGNDLEHITNARGGHIKILIFQDSYLTIKHDNSKIMLNGDADLDPEDGDILVLINIGGDPGVADGYWRELFRTLKA